MVDKITEALVDYDVETGGLEHYLANLVKQFIALAIPYRLELSRPLSTEFSITNGFIEQPLEIYSPLIGTIIIDAGALQSADSLTVVRLIKMQIYYIGSRSSLYDRELIETNVNAHGDGYWDWDTQSNKVYFSPTWKSMLGYSDADLENDFSEWERLLHPDDYEKAKAKAGRLLTHPKEIYQSEFRMRCKNGKYKWILARGKVFNFFSDGRPERIVGSHVDLDRVKSAEGEAKRLEVDLYLNQEVIKLIGDEVKIGAWHLDISRKQLYWTPEVKKIHGLDENFEPQLETSIEFYKEGWSRELIHERVERALENNEPFDEELIIVDATGQEKWVRALGRPYKVGNKQYLAGILQDITEQKSLIAELAAARKSEQDKAKRLVLAARAGKIGFWDLDIRSSELYWDNQMKAIYGVKPSEFKGQLSDWRKRVVPSDLEEAEQAIQQTLETGKIFNTIFRIKTAQGESRIISASADVLRNENGESVRMVGVNLDITEQTLYIEKQQEIAKKAEEVSQAKSQFLATMSHEIRTPLNGIIGMIELAKKESLPDKTLSKLNVAESSAAALLGIINDILDLSKIESGKIEVERLRVSLSEMIESVIAIFEHSLNSKKLDFCVEKSFDARIIIETDPVRFKQILMNLLSNAVKFTHEGRVGIEVNFDQAAQPAELSVTVTDTGVGIAEEYQHKLFQEFSQVDTSTTRKYGGTGLGLSISKHLVELLGGRIEFKSQEGEGSVFRFSIPIENFTLAQQSKQINDSLDTEKLNKLKSNRVIIAEDNRVNQLVIYGQLKDYFKEVSLVDDGLALLEQLKRDKEGYDVLIVDCEMPNMDGFEATRKIRAGEISQRYQGAPIIAITANAFREDREKCLQAGMSAFLAKPTSTEAIIKEITRLMD